MKKSLRGVNIDPRSAGLAHYLIFFGISDAEDWVASERERSA